MVYRLPPRQTNKGYRAADWGLDKPLWTGRLKVTLKGKKCTVSLTDTTTGALFAEAPIDSDPSNWVESVIDSSRYFVLKVVNQGRHAFLGMGFADRSEAFDFSVALQDFGKSLKKSADAQTEEEYVPKHDLKMAEGQTIKINIKTKKRDDDDEEPATKSKSAPMGKSGIDSPASQPRGSFGLSRLDVSARLL
ncbi:uncharacterized protein MONBRDRAFT_27404 [Monosiga brevicollis MX1]|uniref:NECAP PHear domain-containing protein n=1 Tax=Monosiga brevicollis TaxID=81824 RepID=A9V568_MONBE|nr:uncharacterized protein MONBRDRAFT_27404 [Monosiga brevicollis MX1]EDQ87326.1 predicted protein [Monosiga brevicollis MX1]|eukprot:XP_001747939.1 hypothetical protein [Monosiga brevicollis MX1]